MRNITVALLLLFSLIILNSCNEDDDDCLPMIFEVSSLENEYDCVNTPYQMDIDLSEEFIIIRSQAEFNNLVTGSCTPEIDFTSYDLLIGKKGLVSGFDSIDYDGLVKNCINNQLSLTITFILNVTAEAPNVTYHALVPKLAPNEVINVSIVTI